MYIHIGLDLLNTLQKHMNIKATGQASVIIITPLTHFEYFAAVFIINSTVFEHLTHIRQHFLDIGVLDCLSFA